jgi:hypothetical protein
MTFAGPALPVNRDGVTVAAAHVGGVPWSVVVVGTSGCASSPTGGLASASRHIFSARTGRRFDRLYAKSAEAILAKLDRCTVQRIAVKAS